MQETSGTDEVGQCHYSNSAQRMLTALAKAQSPASPATRRLSRKVPALFPSDDPPPDPWHPPSHSPSPIFQKRQ